MVATMLLFVEIVSKPFEIKHTSNDNNSLIMLIKSVEAESRIVMKHTGRYYEGLAHQLSKSNLFVSAINPKPIKDFDNDSLHKDKSDKADAINIARYALNNNKRQNLKQYSVMHELHNQLKPLNRQCVFYMKHKTAMKNNLIAILVQTHPDVNTYFDTLHVVMTARKGVIFHPLTGMLTVFVRYLLTPSLTTIKSGEKKEI